MIHCEFQQMLKEEFDRFIITQQNKFSAEEILKIDLHCHDLNSDVPDELIGRILNVPETWLPSEKLIETLSKNGCDTFTVTNHNNARSCYKLQDKGIDVLTAAEFSCWVPDFLIGIHVLAYGFTPEQEVKLEKLRKNVYHFLEYARTQDIPTIWAHPLYHYATKKVPSDQFFNKMMLIFERFEVVNGQRDTWQNLLTKEWLEQTTTAEIDKYSKMFGIEPLQFCKDPYRKTMSGGSDCHFGIFAGMTGTYLHIPDLQKRLKTETRSQLALEAIRNGSMAPFGTYQNAEKMTIAFLDYACQIALNYKDPGLVRLLLHKGTTNEKIISFLISNLFCEIKRHQATSSFIRIFHESMMGEKPSLLKKMIVKPVYKPIFDESVKIATKNKETDSRLTDGYYESILKINNQLNNILATRLEKKLKNSYDEGYFNNLSLEDFIEKLELPSSIRTYCGDEDKAKLHAVLLLTLKGTPFIYYGDEIGMENADIPKHKIRDLYGKFFYPFYKGRDGSRTPMQWNDTDFAGFSTTETYLPVNKNYKSINVETESKDENSIYSIYKRMITLRKQHDTLQTGDLEFLNKGNKNILIFSRYLENKKIIVLLNFGFRRKKIENNKVLIVLFSTHKKNVTEIDGTIFLEAFEGLVLESKKF